MQYLKTFFFAFSLASFFLTSCDLGQFEKVKGNGKVVSTTRSVSNFDKVSGSAGLNIILTKGSSEKVVVEADENLQEVITTTVKNGKLIISTNKNIGGSKAKNVYVTFDDLVGVFTSSGANITVKDEFETVSFECSASSGSDLTLEGVTSEDFESGASSGANVLIKKVTLGKARLSVSSAGKITVSGVAGTVKAEASSGGNIFAFNFETRIGKVSASSSGEIRLKVTEELSARASSGGNIIYAGSPQISKQNISSGGRVKSK